MKKQIAVIKFFVTSKFMLTWIFILFNCIIYAQSVAQWTFETSQPANAGPHASELGTGVARTLHAGSSTVTSPIGNGSSRAFSANNWVDGDCFQFEVSTLGYDNIHIAFDQTCSNSGPKSFQLQVGMDTTALTIVPGSNYDVAANSWNAGSANASSAHAFSLPGMGNLPQLIIRVVVVTGSTAVNGSAIATSGTSRIDNVSVTAATTLPVTLIHFDGRRQYGQNILLWKVAEERDISHYIIERSADGVDFTEAGVVQADRNTSEHSYTFREDCLTVDGYYRLRIVHNGGGSTYSCVICIEAPPEQKRDVLLCGNPVRSDLQFEVLGDAGSMQVCVLDVAGRVKLYRKMTGQYIQVDIKDLPDGIYSLKVRGEGLDKTIRFVKR